MNPNPLLALNHFTVPCSLTDVLTFLLSYLCFSTASSRTTKKAASVNLQPLQSNLKVLQEQQTQPKHSMFSAPGLVNCSRAKIMDDGDKINQPCVPSGTSNDGCRRTATAGASGWAHRCSQKESLPCICIAWSRRFKRRAGWGYTRNPGRPRPRGRCLRPNDP
jgi:hypothetical protein